MALNLALVVSLADKASRPLQRLGGAVERLGARADRVGRSLRGVGQSALPRLTLPVAAFGGLALRASGQMEQLEVGFTSMLGSADKAGKLVDDLAKFSARTPFQLPGIGQAARQLLAMEVPQGKVIENLQMIGDIAAGAQVPIEEMTQIYAKSLAKGKVQTEELNQLSERGIPILSALQKLAAKYGHTISKEDVFKAAEKGQIRFETLREALALLTAEGGVFHRQMELQSGTLFGLFSTLKDNAFLALDAIGDKIDQVFDVKGKMKRFTEWIQNGVEWFQRLAEERPGLVKLGFTIAGIAAIAGPALIALGFMASGIGLIASGLGAVTGVLGGILGLITWKVALIAGAAWLIYDHWDDVVAFFERTWKGIREAFPGAAQFFEDLWAGVETPFYEMLGWLRGAWLTVLTWFEGPGKDQSVFDWLSQPVVGAFAWVERQWDAVLRIVSNPRQVWSWLSAGAAGVFGWVERNWNAALAWIEAPDTDIWGWLSDAAAGVFAWVGWQWKAAKALISTPAAEAWSWLSAGAAGVFGWVERNWNAALAWIEAPDTDIWGWLSDAAAGVFAWVGWQWKAAKALISTPAADVWSWLSSGAAGIFGWVERQWNAALAWIEAPDTDIWGWLSNAAAGVFAWVDRQWKAALAWISSPKTNAWGWLSKAGDGVFSWVGLQWKVQLALLEKPATAVWNWLKKPDADVFKWLPARWATVLAGLSAGASIGIALDLPTAEAAAAWVTGLLAALTAAVGKIDFKGIGKIIGTGVRDGFLALMSLFEGDANMRRRVSGAFLSVLKGIGKLMVAVLRGALQLVIGFIDGVFRTDIEAAVDRQWKGIARWVERNTGFDILGDEAPDGRPDNAQAGAFDIWPAAPARESVFGRGGAIDSGAIPPTAAARVGGEVRILVDDRRRARVEDLRSDNPDVPLEAHVGFANLSP